MKRHSYSISGEPHEMAAWLSQKGEDRLHGVMRAGDLGQFLNMQGAHIGAWIEGIDPMATASIESVLREARTAMPANMRIQNPGTQFESVQVLGGMPARAGSVGHLKLSDAVPGIDAGHSRAIYSPANTSDSLAMAILRRSRVASLGARLIPIDVEQPASNGLRTQGSGFMLLGAGTFESGDEESPVSGQSLPVVEESVDLLNGMVSYGLRFEVGRRTQKSYSDSHLSAMIVTGITLALGNLIDRILLERIFEEIETLENAGTATGFDLGSAARMGLRFDELGAIIGTDGDGAQVENGVVRAAGVPALLSSEVPGTCVGAFDRAAVAVNDSIRVLTERGSTQGTLTVTAWVDAQALVPSMDYFWSVA